MEPFTWRDGVLHAEDVPIPTLVDLVDTPTYVYSASSIRDSFRRLEAAFAPLDARFHYAVKANPNLHVCRLLRGLGAGMDVVSGGELERAWLAGTPMSEIVFAGVAKGDDEIRAALDGRFSPLAGSEQDFGRPSARDRGPVRLFNVESESELASIARVGAELGIPARACVRVNPNVDPHTHEYTTTGKGENKFGIDADRVVGLFDEWRGHPGVELDGLHLHIGSPVHTVEPYAEAATVVLTLLDDLEARGHHPRVLDFGGGWPVSYRDGEAPPIEDYAGRLVPLLADRVARGLRIYLEPGRFLVANAGVLVLRVEHLKHGRQKSFVICDGGMNVLLRPALYRSFHFIWPVAWSAAPPRRDEDPGLPGLDRYDVVGPICETGDFLARDRPLPPVEKGDLLAVFSAGAYGMAMASNYNDHPRPAEVMVEGVRARSINERQSLASLFATERTARELTLPAPAIAL